MTETVARPGDDRPTRWLSFPTGRSRIPSLFSNTGWSILASVSIGLARFLTMVLAARLLGPAGSGRLAYLLWISDVVAILFGLGLQTTATRFLAEGASLVSPEESRATRAWFFRAYSAALLIGGAGLAVLGEEAAGGGLSFPVRVILAVYCVLQGVGGLQISVLAGLQRFATAAAFSLASGGLQLLLLAVLIKPFGVAGALASCAAGAAVLVLPGLGPNGGLFAGSGRVPRGARNRIVRFAFFTWLAASVSLLAWSNAELYFLKRFRNLDDVAMFGVGASLAMVPTRVSALLSGALLPYFSALGGGDGDRTLEATYRRATRLIALVSAPGSLMLAAAAPILVPFFYGQTFMMAIPTTMVLAACAVLGFANPGTAVLYAAGRPQFIAAGGVAGGLILVAGCWLAVPSGGPLAAAYVRAGVQLALIALSVAYLRFRLNVRFPMRAVTVSCVVAAVVGLGVFGAARNTSSFIAVLALASAGFCVSVVVAARAGGVSAEDVARLQEVLGALPGRLSGAGKVAEILKGRGRE